MYMYCFFFQVARQIGLNPTFFQILGTVVQISMKKFDNLKRKT